MIELCNDYDLVSLTNMIHTLQTEYNNKNVDQIHDENQSQD